MLGGIWAGGTIGRAGLPPLGKRWKLKQTEEFDGGERQPGDKSAAAETPSGGRPAERQMLGIRTLRIKRICHNRLKLSDF